MAHMIVDIIGIEGVRPGQTVTIFGEDNDAFQSMIEVSKEAEAFPPQFFTNITSRVPRVYYANGMVVSYEALTGTGARL